ncbi:hypothetical protein [Streptomyces sp. NRRL F-5650]|uniref:hypothetical protein n=1 Tax=Streptomyces sp. NRRL F-5650 TaxID=1463868 RepID=UPI0004CC258E|nr:hypothetical protein [Streptomyces sp. NRRL F-5650]
MAFMEQGLGQQARDLIDTTKATEPWEEAVALLWHAHCRPGDAPVPESDLDRTLDASVQLLAHPDAPTAVFQTRTGLSALELDGAGRHTARILDAPSPASPDSTPTPHATPCSTPSPPLLWTAARQTR